MLITKKMVLEFWEYMQGKYGFSVINKNDSSMMKMVDWILSGIGIMDRKEFLNNYSTTVGHSVYIPFVLGEGDSLGLMDQVIICAHEAQHVVQYNKDNAIFVGGYVSSKSRRASYEVEAYNVTMEMYYYFTGKVLSSNFLCNLLSKYAIDEVDLSVSRKRFDIQRKVLRLGIITSDVSVDAIQWWQKREQETGISTVVDLRS